ncbi:hypothetical protein PCAR4_40231 [Paraburkholderia caribensis]|nr:hypothetical protein PCAR4_40231 [Paraburkholderia caribensis]
MVIEDRRQAFSARLNEALDHIRFPAKGRGRQQALADQMGVSQKGARKWLEGESMPEQVRLEALADWLQVNFEWLAKGTGEKRSSLFNAHTGRSFETYKVGGMITPIVEEETPDLPRRGESPREFAFAKVMAVVEEQFRAARLTADDATLLTAAIEAARGKIDPTIRAAILLMLKSQTIGQETKAPSDRENVNSAGAQNSDPGGMLPGSSPEAAFAKRVRTDVRSAAQSEDSNPHEPRKHGT